MSSSLKKNLSLLPVIFIAVISLGTAFYSSTAEAQTCHERRFGRCRWHGYFTNTFDNSGTVVFSMGNQANTRDGLNVNTVNGFISTIRGRLGGSNAQNRTGAAYIINTMMGVRGASASRTPSSALIDEWERRVRAYDAQGRVEWDVSITFPSGYINTYYQGSGSNDVAHYASSAQETRWSIRFNHPSGGNYIIKKNCGNPMGDMTPLDDISFTVAGTRVATGDVPSSLVSSQRVRVRSDRTGSLYDRSSYSGPGFTFNNVPKPSDVIRVTAYNSERSLLEMRIGSRVCESTNSNCTSWSYNDWTTGSSDSQDRGRSLNDRPIFQVRVEYRFRFVDVVGQRIPTGGATTTDVSGQRVRARSPFESPWSTNRSDTTGTTFNMRVSNLTGLRVRVEAENNNSNLQVRMRSRPCRYTGACDSWSGWTSWDNTSVAQNRGSSLYRGGTFQVEVQYRRRFIASCSSSPQVAFPAVIEAGNPFSSTSSFRNDGPVAWPSSGRITARLIHYNATSGNPGTEISRVNTITVPSTASGSTAGVTGTTTPLADSLDEQRVIIQLLLDGSTVLATCTGSFDPYVRFRIEPNINNLELSPTSEDPTSVEFTWSAPSSSTPQVTIAPNVGLRITRTITENGSEIFSNSGYIGSYSNTTPRNRTDSSSVASPEAGVRYCAELSILNSRGLVNADGEVANLTGGGSLTDCVVIVDQPYVSAFGADVIATAGFANVEGNCGGGSQGIISAFFDSGDRRGSGTQFATLAMTQINGFASAKMRESNPIPAIGLSFSNNSLVDDYGGGHPITKCSWDYFAQMPDAPENTANSINNNNATFRAGGVFRYNSSGGVLTVPTNNNAQVAPSVNSVISVDNDVLITNNITFEDWDNLDEIPSFYLIVRGNIYIHSSVTQLAGIYIAQPDESGNGGNIYTCATRTGPGPVRAYSVTEMFNNCQNPLQVNGAFIANTLYLNRHAASSLRLGNQSEFPYGGNNPACDQPVCAAEIFNFSPEIYLNNPLLPPTSVPGQSRYDSITSLPPVL